MIITKQKPIEEILEFLEPYSNVLVVGCDSCTQPPRGLREAETYASLIEMAARLKGKEMKCTATTVVRQCCNEGLRNWLKVEGYDAILSMACGVGVQTLVEVFPEIPVFPAQDTMFIGSEEKREGAMFEKCLACGECMLGETGGICPVTRCAKGLMNGPCGGCVDGKCEVTIEVKDKDGKVVEIIRNDCAWYLIFERLRKLGRLDLFRKYRPPKNRAVAVHPRRL
ncbi:MAG: methylenetetrahydrofolate reductase C-terminal domain-containing protein [Candidatus Methanospirareceae archaeon]